jgi:RHS repeat-associated protein
MLLGAELVKTVFGMTTGLVYDGINAVQELSGTMVTANLLTGGIDEIFSRSDSNGTSIPLANGLGSSMSLTSNTGSLVTSYSYDPFGGTSTSGQSSANPSEYAGRENDNTGLYYYRARYYSPTFGRFISQDSMGFSGGDTNLYSYVGNDPIQQTDSTGLFWPGDHKYITLMAALEIGMDIQEAQALANAVAAVDSRTGTQEPDSYDANTHAMAGRKGNGKWQTCEQAMTGSIAQIADAISNDDLAKALHTVQDAYSPSHRGFQRWDGGMDLYYLTAPFGSAAGAHTPSPGHMWGDLHPLNDAVVLDAIAATRFLLQYPRLNPKSFLPSNPCGD